MFFSFASFAQTEALYSGYLFNGLSINPAYAGYHKCFNANLWGKKQWFGIDGTPVSFLLSAHTPLPNEKSSVGITVFNESWGVNRQTGANGIYSHRIKLKEHIELSGGLLAGVIQYSVDNQSLTQQNASDPVFTQNISRVMPDFSGGLFLNSDKYFVGVSASHIQRNFFQASGDALLYRKQYFISAGALLFSNYDVKIKPSILVRGTEESSLQADLSVNALFKEVLWFGMSYRTSGALVFLSQIKLSQTLDIGYALDLNTSISTHRNFVSHEIMVNQKFSFKKHEVISPRYF